MTDLLKVSPTLIREVMSIEGRMGDVDVDVGIVTGAADMVHTRHATVRTSAGRRSVLRIMILILMSEVSIAALNRGRGE